MPTEALAAVLCEWVYMFMPAALPGSDAADLVQRSLDALALVGYPGASTMSDAWGRYLAAPSEGDIDDPAA